jgi:hypothetical protein
MIGPSSSERSIGSRHQRIARPPRDGRLKAGAGCASSPCARRTAIPGGIRGAENGTPMPQKPRRTQGRSFFRVRWVFTHSAAIAS